MRRSFSSGCFWALLLGLCRLNAASFPFQVSCPAVTVGPSTIAYNAIAAAALGTIDLTPNVPLANQVVLSGGLVATTNNPNSSAGTFTGTLSCTLTFGTGTATFTRSLSLVVPPPSGSVQNGLLTIGAVTVIVNVGAQGTVTISAPSLTVAGFASGPGISAGFPIFVPGASIDTLLLTPAAAPAVPIPPALILVLTGIGAIMLYFARHKFAAG